MKQFLLPVKSSFFFTTITLLFIFLSTSTLHGQVVLGLRMGQGLTGRTPTDDAVWYYSSPYPVKGQPLGQEEGAIYLQVTFVKKWQLSLYLESEAQTKHFQNIVSKDAYAFAGFYADNDIFYKVTYTVGQYPIALRKEFTLNKNFKAFAQFGAYLARGKVSFDSEEIYEGEQLANVSLFKFYHVNDKDTYAIIYEHQLKVADYQTSYQEYKNRFWGGVGLVYQYKKVRFTLDSRLCSSPVLPGKNQVYPSVSFGFGYNFSKI